MLEKLGFYVETAANGHEALALIKKRAYDFIFLDLDLPDIHGLDLAPQLLTAVKEDNKPLPIILSVTSYSSEAVREDYLQYGISGVILKPISIDELSAVINEFKQRENKPPEA